MTTILFFGRLRDVAGCSEMLCDLPQQVSSVADVRAWLAARDPVLGKALHAPGVRVAVDRSFCTRDDQCAGGAAEIAFMSPLSGG
ncbi:MoaD/ThiS family protein [Terricaulis sp.]|uniref:MoaD/ThiS family protein n=1 Tax=Terricaulis sp. TaxID=2768686 RepID=UPI003782F8A5